MIIYKIKSAIIANKLNKHLHENNLWPFEQFGTLEKTQGSKEVLLLDAMIANEVRTYQRNIYMAWTDVKKAFDSVCQNHILRIMEVLGVPKWIINWIKEAMKTWRTKLQIYINGTPSVTEAINIICGIFQGDSLSPVLFCISYIFVSIIIRNLRIGYIPGVPGKRVASKMRSHIIFMDDFKAFSSNIESFKKILTTSIDILKEVGLEVGYDKCAVMKVERGKVVQMDGIKISLDNIIEEVKMDKGYPYLGILELLDPCHDKTKNTMKELVTKISNVVWSSKLSERNKVSAHNMFVVSKLTYTFGIINWTQNELDELDCMVRKVAAEHGSLNKHSNCQRLYLKRKDGGRGLLNIHDTHNRTVASLVAYIFNARSEHAKLIKEFWINKKEGTQLKKVEDLMEELNAEIRFSEDGVHQNGELINHKKVGSILKTTYQKSYKLWCNTELHGRVISKCIDKGISVEKSFDWLETAGLRGEAVATVFAIQEQVMPTRVIKKRIWRNSDVETEKCRLCNNALETISHIVNGCTVLAATLYKERHDNVLRGIYYYLLHTNGFTEEWYPWYNLQYVEVVKENDICIITWDKEMQTNHYTKYNKPDIIVIYKNEDKILLIEGSCPWDENRKEKVIEKQNKYKQLAFQLKSMYKKKICEIAAVVIGATGTVDKSFDIAMAKISKSHIDSMKLFRNCQKAAILGTIRICRQVFDGNC